MIAFQEFLAYKTRVPVRGAILVNHDLDSVVLVRGWKKGASWSFPRGKINKDEPDLDCAIREVYEETGYNVRDAGLVPGDEDVKYIEMSMRDQHVRLYVFRDVPMDTYFEPRTRKEISKIQWYKLSELPTQKRGKNNQQDAIAGDLANHANKFYMVAPFIHGLKKWITQQKKLSKHVEGPKQILSHEATTELIAPVANQKSELPVGLTVDGSPRGHEVGQHAVSLNGFEQSLQLPTPTLTALPHAPDSASGTEISEANIREKKSQSLLALLQGKPISNATELPQTPAEQVVIEPQMPPSPKHHVKPKQPLQLREIFPSLHAANQALQTNQDPIDHILVTRPKNREEFIHNTLRQNHPNLIPETNQSYPQVPGHKPIRESQNHRPVIPSNPSTKSAFASLEQSTGFASAIPAASKLPPPKLTAQSSKLLDLFKSNKPAQAALEAIPDQQETSGLGAELGHFKEPANIVEQVSLEVSEIEDHHVGKGGHSNRAPSEMSFEMPANVDDVNLLPNSTPPRTQTAVRQSPRDNLAAWQSFQSTDAVRQAKERQNFTEREAARVAEETRTGVKSESVQPIFQETWKKVKISDDDAERTVVKVTKHNTDLNQGGSQRAVDRVPVPKLSSHEQELNGATTGREAIAASEMLNIAPSTVDGNQKTVLVVENLGTAEAVHCMFPDIDRANILHVQSSGKRRHLVHFTSNEETLAALGRLPPQFRTKQGKPSPGQPRKPRVYPISLADRRPLDQHDHAGQRAQLGDSHSSAPGKARQYQAAHGLFEAESNGPAVKTQPAMIPTVVTPSPPTLQPRRSEHQHTLLNLFKAPPAVPNGSPQVTKSALEAPTPSFELSAMPSPGHSREQSRLAGPLGVQPIGDLSHILPMSLPTVKRQKATLAPRKSPVSATVDGPLNVPQFDMLTQKHQADKEAAVKDPNVGASRKSPITILARPSKSPKAVISQIQAGPITNQQDSTAPSPPAVASTALPSKQSFVPAQLESQPHVAPPPYTALPPSPIPPPTLTSASTKPPISTPQTIRRPVHIRPQAHDSILSPISPLPSPKHSLPFDRRIQQTKEQKKSLLSIFNNPNSPTPSPIATETSVVGKEVKKATGAIVMGPPPLPPSRVDSTASALVSPPAVQVDFGSLSRTGTGKSVETPSSGRQTPKDTKSFLLGYLDSVAQGGR